MAISEADEAALAAKFAVMRPFLDERGWRVYLGTEARVLGYGGIAVVARASGASETTVAAGARQAADQEALGAPAPGRSRRPGAGRPKAEDARPGLKEALDGLLEEGKRGDPMSAVTWNILSLRDIARQMTVLGFGCSKDTVARLMHAGGYSLRGMSRVLEGRQHEDRDAQFRNINAKIGGYQAAGQPVISVDGKKKERLGAYHRDGRSWRRKGDPVQVRSHDFPDKDTVTIAPYGIYDIAANRGFVSVGTSCDTAAFAVSAIRLWWQEEGSLRYPGAGRLLVTCDAGGSNGARCRLWKDQLAVLAAQAGLVIEVCHFPPGTSKWNKIEHRLFCHVTRTWKARPLMTVDDAVAGIAATITGQGLKCHPVRDDNDYPGGIKVSDARMKYLEDRVLERDPFHGEWNYAVMPAPRAAPEPEPAPARPGRVPQGTLSHPALTGIAAADMNALAAALEAQFEARLQLHYRTRHGRRARAARGSAPHGNRQLDVTDHLLALRLRDHLNLPVAAVGALLGIGPGSVSHVTALAQELLAGARITLPAGPPPGQPPRNPGELLAYAAGAGIPLTLPENGQTMPEHFRTRRNRATRDTPETPN
ncbi:MAG: ISAzo13 family transposase [Streptosporangiaceae bacterium]